MAVFTDGTTTLTIDYVDEDIAPSVESTASRTAGGSLRTVTGGERLTLDIMMRLTPAQYRTFITINTSNSDNLYYTPEDTTAAFWASLYPDLNFPLLATIKNIKPQWDNRSYWYVKATIESTDYL